MPVIGVPLPFISYGGSALLMSLCAIGVVLSLAREQMAPAMRPKRMLKFKARKDRDKSHPKNARKRA
jgi:cell division protein FtsW